MKKIILAPAVALAFTGLVASPVAAAESTSAQSTSSQTAEQKKVEAHKAKKAEAKKKADAEAAAKKAEADKKAKEKAAAEKKAAADKKAKDAKAAAKKKADEKKAAEDKADKKDDAKKPPKKVAPKPAPAPKDEDKDAKDDDNSEDKVNPINASVQVVSGDVTAEELHEDGVTVKVTGLEKGDKVSAKSGLTGPAVTAQGSTATMKLRSAKELSQESVAYAVQVQRAGTSPDTVADTLNLKRQGPAPGNISLPTNEISIEDFEKNGIDYSGAGFTPEAQIKVYGGHGKGVWHGGEDTATADAEGNISGHLNAPAAEYLEAGTYLVYAVDPKTGSTKSVEFTVTDDSVTPIDASIKVDPKEIAAEDLANKDKGVTVTVTGVKKGDKITDSLTGKTETADADGDYKLHLWYEGKASDLEVGKLPFTVNVEREGTESETLNGEINVVDEDEAVDAIDASLKVDPKEITAEDLANKDKGVTVTVTGVKKGDKIKDSLTGKTEIADADGDYKLHLWYEGNPDSLEAGKVPFTVTIDREGTESETLNGNINIVAEDSDDDGDNPEAPAEATFKVSPKTIEAADFANEKKGVTLAVENCEPGADVHFEVNPKGINVTAYENSVKADDEGNASVNVFGTSSDVSAYVGAYTATATCGDDTMKDSFMVTEGANGGGSGGGDNGNAGNGGDDGSQLPRTGADLGGLTTGALLLLVGGAAIALTGRKNKIGQTPTSF
ncbi:hypothetical protein [Brevibacterium permense]|uniref:LPXTG cell wall anchor domain-containing protein n=1 Tax=Brevibacterium permense TaxID=234834 RepID=A0ABN2A511_9MICO|nr:hypothetical protein [Brevibacterium permense]